MGQFTRCHLHIPHKQWATPPEKANYTAIEQWTREFYNLFLLNQTLTKHLLLIPNKAWADNEHELQNYLELERWSRILPSAARVFITGSSKYDLHIPHKKWAEEAGRDNATEELENYLAIERWAERFIRGCMPGGNH